MINISKYINSQDALELHINPANIDLLSVTRFISGYEAIDRKDQDELITMHEHDSIPIYDDHFRRVKMIISGTPLDITVPEIELDEFLTNFNLERGK